MSEYASNEAARHGRETIARQKLKQQKPDKRHAPEKNGRTQKRGGQS